MGLLDILQGMQNGPGGQRQPSSSGSGGGMSPVMMALLGAPRLQGAQGQRRSGCHSGRHGAAGFPSLWGYCECEQSGRRARRCSGRAAGQMEVRCQRCRHDPGWRSPWRRGGRQRAGLGNLIKEFQQSGHGRTAQSWVGTGPNQVIAPNDLANALGNDTLNALSQKTGLGREDLLTGSRQHLPDLIDKLTPNGRLPTDEEASRMV